MSFDRGDAPDAQRAFELDHGVRRLGGIPDVEVRYQGPDDEGHPCPLAQEAALCYYTPKPISWAYQE